MLFSGQGWSHSSAVRLEVDEGVAGLGQLCNGDSTSLLDVLGHGCHLLCSDVDELSPVINDTCRANTGPCSQHWELPSLPNRQHSLLWEGMF